MRALADAGRVRELMRALGRGTREPASVYFTGGATAVLYGWRGSTADVDLRLEPDRDEILKALVDLKERLSINIELASPQDFVPVSDDWRARSPFIERQGGISFHHFDLYAQALSKTERHHAQDIEDVQAMLRLGLIESQEMLRYHARVAPLLHRYPSLDPDALREAVERLFRAGRSTGEA
ncbi:MAG: DUF6036 family nucleotidyltransferase [Gemmatimonadota bacterium]